MITFIVGGSKNGKSHMAEKIVTSGVSEHLYYVATMHKDDEESKQRVLRHRMKRQGKGFITVEQYVSIGRITEQFQGKNVSVLLECLSNLLANEMFDMNGTKVHVVEKIIEDINKIAQQVEHLVIVSNQVSDDGCEYDCDTMDYIQKLGTLNQEITKIADCVIEAVCGIPIVIKGECDVMNQREKSGCGLELIIGGQSQGKLEYLLGQKMYGKEEIAAVILEDKPVIYNIHRIVRNMLLEYKDASKVRNQVEEWLNHYIERQPGGVILCNEVGSGIVPMDAFEREYRDLCGTITCMIAARANRVHRVICGIGMVIKDDGNTINSTWNDARK